MKNVKYNLINGPKKTVNDYLHSLNNDELQVVYNTSFFYDLKMPGLLKKLQSEIQQREMNAMPALF